MRALIRAAAFSLSMCVISSTSGAEGRTTAGEAVAMVKRAAGLIKSDGKTKAFAAITDFSNTNFHDRDLYIYVYDLNGVTLAHGNNPKMVGQSLINLRDYEGKLFIREMLTVVKTKGSGWVTFKWPNPITKMVEAKSGYVERVDDMMVGSGIYR